MVAVFYSLLLPPPPLVPQLMMMVPTPLHPHRDFQLFCCSSSVHLNNIFPDYCGNRPNKRNPSPGMTLVVHDLITMQSAAAVAARPGNRCLASLPAGPWIFEALPHVSVRIGHRQMEHVSPPLPSSLHLGWWLLSIRVGIIMSFIMLHCRRRSAHGGMWAGCSVAWSHPSMIVIIIAISLNRVALSRPLMTHPR